MWRDVIVTKFGMDEVDVPPLCRFHSLVKLSIGDGKRMRMWIDSRMNTNPVSKFFPDIDGIVLNQEVTIVEYMQENG